MLVRREQTPVALLTVHSLKGRRALPFYDLQNGWVPRRGRVTTARHSCPDVPIFGLPCFYFSIKHSIPHFFKRSGSQELPCKKYTILVPNSKEIIYFFKTFPDLRVFSKKCFRIGRSCRSRDYAQYRVFGKTLLFRIFSSGHEVRHCRAKNTTI